MNKTSRRAVLRGMAAIAAAGTFASRSGAAAESAARGTSAKWDVIVVGAGVFGAWTAWKLNRLGQKVLLVDAWGPAHTRASSGGESRLTRTEYGGDELYTRMAWDSLADWRTLSEHAGMPIFHPVGALYMYQKESPAIAASTALHERLGIPMTRLSRRQMEQRYPQIGFDGIILGVLQPTMGALMARRAVQTLVAQFTAAGGEYRQISIQPPRAGTTLDSVTGNGETLQASKYVFACGPWMPKLFPDVIGSRIQPTRQDVFFFAPAAGDARFQGEHLPAWVDPDHKNQYYGFPSLEQRGFKIALDAYGPKFDPDAGDRQVTAEAVANVREYLAVRFPALARRPLSESRVCQYENSANGDFIVDRHPAWTNTWLVGGGSGHGFKHGPEVGRYTAELVTGRLRAIEPRFALAKHATQDSPS
jgi:sarcosine oxidase